MKRAFLIYLFLICVCWGILTPTNAAAQKAISEHLPTDKMLEFSLTRLKESVQETLHKNDRLYFENDVLRQSIRDLLRKREVLLRRLNGLTGLEVDYELQEKEFPRVQSISDENRKARVQELIAIFQRDNKQLEEKVTALDQCLDQGYFEADKKALSEKKKKIGKNLSEAQRELEALRRRNQGTEKQIKELQGLQNELIRAVKEARYRATLFK